MKTALYVYLKFLPWAWMFGISLPVLAAENPQSNPEDSVAIQIGEADTETSDCIICFTDLKLEPELAGSEPISKLGSELAGSEPISENLITSDFLGAKHPCCKVMHPLCLFRWLKQDPSVNLCPACRTGLCAYCKSFLKKNYKLSINSEKEYLPKDNRCILLAMHDCPPEQFKTWNELIHSDASYGPYPVVPSARAVSCTEMSRCLAFFVIITGVPALLVMMAAGGFS